jgi:hypothetical protein
LARAERGVAESPPMLLGAAQQISGVLLGENGVKV